MKVEINYKTKKYETLEELKPGQCFEVVGDLDKVFIFTDDYSFVNLKDGSLMHIFDSEKYVSETPVIIRNDLKIIDK